MNRKSNISLLDVAVLLNLGIKNLRFEHSKKGILVRADVKFDIQMRGDIKRDFHHVSITMHRHYAKTQKIITVWFKFLLHTDLNLLAKYLEHEEDMRVLDYYHHDWCKETG